MDSAPLVNPISESAPCGVDLDGTPLLGEFDRIPLFGQMTPRTDQVDLLALRRLAHEALTQSKDFRPLTYLAVAELRLSGLESFVVLLEVAARWLQDHWDDVYPRIDDDAILRQNSLVAFADRMAMIDALRRVPLVTHRQLGSFSLRDVELATGALKPGEDEQSVPTEVQIGAAFANADAAALQDVHVLLGRALAAADLIESVMSERTDGVSVPDLDPLRQAIRRMRDVVQPYLGSPQQDPGSDDALERVPKVFGSQPAVTGPIRTREDAARALDAVAQFFRQYEPSSPVPLFADRARRLISMDFVQLLGEIAPGSLPEVRGAAGLREKDQ